MCYACAEPRWIGSPCRLLEDDMNQMRKLFQDYHCPHQDTIHRTRIMLLRIEDPPDTSSTKNHSWHSSWTRVSTQKSIYWYSVHTNTYVWNTSTSEYKGNNGGYLPERRSREGRYLHGIARRSNEYEVGISFIAYTSVPLFSWASGQYTVYCPLSQLKLTERACTQKHGLLRLSAPSWNPRLRSRDMQWSMVQHDMMSLHSDVHCTTLDRSVDNYIHHAMLYSNCLGNFEY